jgi:hypothetical protein
MTDDSVAAAVPVPATAAVARGPPLSLAAAVAPATVAAAAVAVATDTRATISVMVGDAGIVADGNDGSAARPNKSTLGRRWYDSITGQ